MNKLSDYDKDQIIKYTFDETTCAQRVNVVGGKIDVDASQVANTIKESLESSKLSVHIPEQKVIEVPVITKEIVIERVEIPVIVKEIEIRTIEVPVVIKETQWIEREVIVPSYEKIEVPIIVKETQWREIEKPIYIDRIKPVIKVPHWAWLTMGIEFLIISLLTLLKH